MAMLKIALSLPESMIRALAVMEKETDRQRSRIIRRAVADALLRYDHDNPGFMDRVGGPVEMERELKPGLVTDVAVIRGVKQEVVVMPGGGWRPVGPDDYIETSRDMRSVLDKEASE